MFASYMTVQNVITIKSQETKTAANLNSQISLAFDHLNPPHTKGGGGGGWLR